MLTKLRPILVCLSLLLGGPIFAATLNVGPGQPYTTIQSAINAANPGDTVLVAPGTYYENINFLGKAITVTSSAGPATTIIDGGGATGAVVSFVTGELRNSVISNFTIRNGGNVPPNSYPPQSSGGVYAYKSAPTILNNLITANACNGVINDTGAPLIQGNTISATIGNTNGECVLDRGSAILLYGYNLNLGPGIVPTVQGNIISDNVQGIYGFTGGIFYWSGDYTIVQNNIFRNNVGTEAGAIASANTNTVSILQNLFYNNSGAAAGAIELLPPAGGFTSVGPFVGILAGNTFTSNINTYPGPLNGVTAASQVELDGDLGQYLMVNNILVGNQPGTAAMACNTDGYYYLEITPLVFDHNDIYAAQGTAYTGTCADQTGIYGNISADPEFVNPAAGNYQLTLGSPAIDTGNNSAPLMPSTDFAGNPRIQDSTGKGYPVVDMGAYELTGQHTVAPTILTLTPSEYFNQYLGYRYPPLTFTITLASSAGIPTGPVTIYQDLNSIGTVTVGATGTATFNGSNITPGLHAFIATFSASGAFPPAVSVKFYLDIPLITTALTLTSSPNSSIFNTPVTFTVNASATDGSIPSPITLTDTTSNTLLATLTPSSSGVATFVTSTLALGAHNITAAFAGDSTHNPSSASLTQNVLAGYPTTTTLSCNPTTLYINGTSLFLASVSSATGIPTGSIQFADNSTNLAPAAITNGNANLTYTATAVGTHLITATYIPTGSYAGSVSIACNVSVVLRPSTVTIASSVNPSAIGQSTTFTATVSFGGAGQNLTGSVGSGSVTFTDGANPLQTVNLAATTTANTFTAVFTTSALGVGLHTIAATFNPNPGYSPGSAVLAQTVNGLPDTATLTVSPASAQTGAYVTLTATITAAALAPTPTGTITFLNGSTAVGTQTLTNSVAALAIANLLPGTDPLSCTYSGDVNFAPSSCNTVPATITAIPTTLTLGSSTNPIPGGTLPTTFTVHLAIPAGPAGNEAVLLSYQVPGAAKVVIPLLTDSTGTASYTAPAGTFPVGSTIVSAAFAATPTLAASSASISQAVTPESVTVSLSVSPNPGYVGQIISIYANISDVYVPSGGHITLLDNGVGVNTIYVTELSTLIHLQFAQGTHVLSLSFTGDAYQLPATSTSVTLTILPSDFTLASTPAAISLQTGHHLTFSLNYAPIGNFADQLQLSAASLPAHTTLQFKPASVAVGASAQTTTSVYLDTDDVIGYLSQTHSRDAGPFSRGILAALLLPWLALIARRRPRLPVLLTCLLAGALLVSSIGCSGKYPASTAPGSYTIPITATGATTGVTHTLLIPFTVTE